MMKVLPNPVGNKEFEDDSILVTVTALLLDWGRIKKLVDQITTFVVSPNAN